MTLQTSELSLPVTDQVPENSHPPITPEGSVSLAATTLTLTALVFGGASPSEAGVLPSVFGEITDLGSFKNFLESVTSGQIKLDTQSANILLDFFKKIDIEIGGIPISQLVSLEKIGTVGALIAFLYGLYNKNKIRNLIMANQIPYEVLHSRTLFSVDGLFPINDPASKTALDGAGVFGKHEGNFYTDGIRPKIKKLKKSRKRGNTLIGKAIGRKPQHDQSLVSLSPNANSTLCRDLSDYFMDMYDITDIMTQYDGRENIDWEQIAKENNFEICYGALFYEDQFAPNPEEDIIPSRGNTEGVAATFEQARFLDFPISEMGAMFNWCELYAGTKNHNVVSSVLNQLCTDQYGTDSYKIMDKYIADRFGKPFKGRKTKGPFDRQPRNMERKRLRCMAEMVRALNQNTATRKDNPHAPVKNAIAQFPRPRTLEFDPQQIVEEAFAERL